MRSRTRECNSEGNPLACGERMALCRLARNHFFHARRRRRRRRGRRRRCKLIGRRV